VEILPAFVVETLGIAAKVLICEFAGFLDVVDRENLAGEIGFDDVLQAGDLRMIEKAAAGTYVGVDVAGVRRILPPVGEFVAVGGQDRIEAEWLDGGLLGCGYRVGSWRGLRTQVPWSAGNDSVATSLVIGVAPG
jgi:hypothetical protein